MNLRESMKRFRTKNLSEQTNFSASEPQRSGTKGPTGIFTPLDDSPKSIDPKYQELLEQHKAKFLEVLAKTRFHRNPQVWREVQGLRPQIDRLYNLVVSQLTLKTANEYRDKILEIRKKWTPFVRNAMTDNYSDERMRDQKRRQIENMMTLASNKFDDSFGNFIKGDLRRFEQEMKESIKMYSNIARMQQPRPM